MIHFNKELIEELLYLKWWDYSDSEINKIVPLLQMPLNKEILQRIKSLLNN